MLRTIKGEKIRKMRGERSLRAIAAASNGVFSDISLLGWEKEDYEPRKEKIPVLLRVLGCDYEDITEAVELKGSQN